MVFIVILIAVVLFGCSDSGSSEPLNICWGHTEGAITYIKTASKTGLDYWNTVAGREVLVFSDSDCDRTVDIKQPDNPEFAGVDITSTKRIEIASGYSYDWTVYAHEFGHALGFNHYGEGHDGCKYQGIMNYNVMNNKTILIRKDDTELFYGTKC